MTLDVKFYTRYYNDLKDMSAEEARFHFETFGQNENRFSNPESLIRDAEEKFGKLPPNFNPYMYIALNDELRGLEPTWEAALHFLRFGRNANKRFNVPGLSLNNSDDVFDFDFYTMYYPDLSGFDPDSALSHYNNSGRAEGRFPNKAAFLRVYETETKPLPDDFKPEDYLKFNPELKIHLQKPWEAEFHYLKYGRWEGRRYKQEGFVYDKSLLNKMLVNIYDMPEVLLSDDRPATVNVLVPAFDFGSMSAGFFGVFQVALFIKRCGFAVRLVMYDEFDFDANYMREKLKNYPGLEDLLDKVEVEYIGDRKAALSVSRHDRCVATVWYSAYLAKKIGSVVDNPRFLYLIQDYETVFYASSSHYAVADATYSFDFTALFSSLALQNFFIEEGIGRLKDSSTKFAYFNNACSRSLEKRSDFIEKRRNKKVKRLAFYSRPIVNRNMFELGALALCNAVDAGVFEKDEWEFYGIGLGDATIKLGDRVKMEQLPRMNLKEYQDLISSFDVGLCLMASSHPSLLPFDLAGSGAVVVTNSFGVKDQAYFDSLVSGVIVSRPDVFDIVDALRKAVYSCDDIEKRFENAVSMRFPTSWDDTFDEAHEEFISSAFSNIGVSRKVPMI